VKITTNLLLLAALGFALLGCSKKAESIGNGVAPSQVMQADYVVVSPQAVANKISVTGTLMPAESAMLSAQTSGLVKTISFKEGERVAKGQLLVRLDDRQWLAQQQKLAAQLQTAQRDLERKKQLAEIKGISQAEVDDAALLVASIEADKQELDVMIEYSVIRAPFNGQIGLRSGSPGAYLSAGDPVARLVQMDQLKLEFNVPERYATQVRKGQAVVFAISGDDATYQGTVYATEPAISETTRALRIRALVPNRNGQLIAGAFAEVNLTLDNIPAALLLPAEAVVPQLNDQVVYQIKGGVIKQVPVKLGIQFPRLVEVVHGLSAGDTIMVAGLLQAKDGLPVQAGQEMFVEKMEN